MSNERVLSPEFSEYSEEVLERVIRRGAAKIGGLVCPSSIDSLQRGVSLDPEIFFARISELAAVKDGLEKLGPSSTTVREESLPASDKPLWHVDYTLYGISILVPFEGPPAYFATTDKSPGDTVSPEHLIDCWEYAVGDVMFIHQKIQSINGVEVDLPQVNHAGVSCGDRSMATIDVGVRELSMDRLSSSLESYRSNISALAVKVLT